MDVVMLMLRLRMLADWLSDRCSDGDYDQLSVLSSGIERLWEIADMVFEDAECVPAYVGRHRADG